MESQLVQLRLSNVFLQCFFYSNVSLEMRILARNLKGRIERGIARENQLKICGGNVEVREADLKGCVAA